MNQHQIKVVLENVNLIKEAFNVTGDRAFVMYKEMLKTEYDEYVGLKEKTELTVGTVTGDHLGSILNKEFEEIKKSIDKRLVEIDSSSGTINISCNCSGNSSAKEFAQSIMKEIQSSKGGR